ncbi:AraC family transcriptional regulator [Chitinophaga sp. Cy-1792]|uniref:helix-turn-helix domain-containing protein n=1 Tax=Chitinophaga sp. Cy-1792 TaxID=2608339 RepID=UPI001420574B|nr:helix-turn-helix domain-containing protein [Chitinophaga sp. Cy-1792]NIG54688.1 AraC family transcriptional regulator [Chitinophaga sp. Cy-1792]
MSHEIPYHIKTIAEYHRLLGIDKPRHPLFSVIDHADIRSFSDEKLKSKVYDFYAVSRKCGYEGTMKYGQHYYDFDDGVMVFHGPRQVIVSALSENLQLKGWTLLIHPDFMRGYALAARMKDFGFFSYQMHEALHLSEEESAIIERIMNAIRQEYHFNIDKFSQDILISQVEQLLNYCNRFYNRQFITRKAASNDVLTKFEKLLTAYFEDESLRANGIPAVQYFSDRLHLSPKYLSDLLRNLTGQSTQQHIQDKLIETAKDMLTTTNLSVSEIAYSLGFGYAQSFNKMFKNKTNVTPVAYRQSFN